MSRPMWSLGVMLQGVLFAAVALAPGLSLATAPSSSSAARTEGESRRVLVMPVSIEGANSALLTVPFDALIVDVRQRRRSHRYARLGVVVGHRRAVLRLDC